MVPWRAPCGPSALSRRLASVPQPCDRFQDPPPRFLSSPSPRNVKQDGALGPAHGAAPTWAHLLRLPSTGARETAGDSPRIGTLVRTALVPI